MRPSPIQSEVDFYRRKRLELVAAHDGEFVLIKGEEILGYFGTLEEALDEGYRRFGFDAFLARRIAAVDETINVTVLLGVA